MGWSFFLYLSGRMLYSIFFAGEAHMEKTIVVLGFIYGATNMCSLVSFGLGAEVIDDNWIRTGIRSDGVIYSCISFSTKL